MNRHVPPHELDLQSAPDPREAATFSARAEPDFRQAQRHSRRVRVVRRILPFTVIVAVLLLGAGAVLARLKSGIDLPFDIGHLSLNGSRLTMDLPKLSGFTDDNRSYRVNAKTASQDLTRPDVIDLTDVDARMEMASNGWVSVNSRTGSFDTKRQLISLGNGVDLAMKDGYAGRLQDADIDVKAGTIVTSHPVVFTYLDGKLVADGLTVSDRGAKALFQGNVQLDFSIANLPGSQKGDGARSGAKPGSKPAAPKADAKGEAPRSDGAKPATQTVQAGQPAADTPLPPRRPEPNR